MTLCTGLEQIAWLVRDDPQGGHEVAADVVSRWSDRGYHLVHYWALFAAVQTDLYLGDPIEAHARVRTAWKALRGSGLFRIQGIKREAQHTRARVAIAAAAVAPPAEARRLLREAQQATKSLSRDQTALAAVWGLAQRAGIAQVGGDTDGAVVALRRAIEGADAGSIAVYGAAARRHLGVLQGGEQGRELVTEADQWMRSQSVVRPPQFASMLIPGFAE